MNDNSKGKRRKKKNAANGKNGGTPKPSDNGQEGIGANGRPDKTPDGLSYQFYLRLKATAKLRVEGATWDQIARKYRYKTATSAKVSIAYRDKKVWKRIYKEFKDEFGDEYEAESILTLRVLQRDSKDEKGKIIRREDTVKRSAANSLLYHIRALKEKSGGDVHVNVPVTVGAGEKKEGEGEGDPIDRLAARLEERRRLRSSKS